MTTSNRASEKIAAPRSSRDLALRTHPLIFGVAVFLASDLMFFGGLLTSYYVLRDNGGAWPPPGVDLDTGEALVGTIFLAFSSATMGATTHYLAARKTNAARFWLGATIVLGCAFEAIAVHGWGGNHFTINSHAYGSLFYIMTGIHALHVLIGILLLALLFFGVRATAFERDDRAGAEAIGFYWHFVFAVWLLIWGTIYYVR